MDLRPGLRIAGRYVLDRLLGEGGMGVVWAAKHSLTSKRVALKFLKSKDASRRKRFLREARISGTIRHRNLIEILDVLELDDGTPVIVMDLLDGESLEDALRKSGSLSLATVASFSCSIAQGLAKAHGAGVVHRDLKPANIFVVAGENGREIKIIDFGIAKLTALDLETMGSGALTATGDVIGTPHYMAPEQIFGDSDIDRRADIWSLGVILYECLSGRKPFAGENFGQIFKAVATTAPVPLQDLTPGIPESVASLVMRMLSRDRKERPESVLEIEQTMRVFENATSNAATLGPRSESIQAAMIPSLPSDFRIRRTISRARLVMGIASVALVASIVAVIPNSVRNGTASMVRQTTRVAPSVVLSFEGTGQRPLLDEPVAKDSRETRKEPILVARQVRAPEPKLPGGVHPTSPY